MMEEAVIAVKAIVAIVAMQRLALQRAIRVGASISAQDYYHQATMVLPFGIV